MAFNDKILTSLHGRRIGLQLISTAQSGGSIPREFLVGPDTIRDSISTAETTSTRVSPSGISVLPGTSAASSAVYTIDPPIPGTHKTIVGGIANGPVYLKTANAEVIYSTAGSSHTTVLISSVGGAIELVGLTTGVWAAVSLTAGFTLSTST